MKSVLISIRPKYCELIASGQKTIEVRKTMPNIKTPFKCYIYCTLPKTQDDILWTGDVIPGLFKDCANGKVIGEFVCKNINGLFAPSTITNDNSAKNAEYVDLFNKLCITPNELNKYNSKQSAILYAWHISDLKIYQNPKELSEFTGRRDFKNSFELRVLEHPPQSWCYVEEIYE